MKKSVFWSTVFVAAIAIATAHAQTSGGPSVPLMRGDGPPPEAKPFSITRNDPALDQIISPDAQAG